MKTYVLTISKTFPVKHRRAGLFTHFKEKITILPGTMPKKIHTVRSNFNLWKKRIDETNEGKAIISLRQWSGKPYNSPQVEFMQLGKGEVGYQEIFFLAGNIYDPIVGREEIELSQLAENDGLSKEDFMGWFIGYDLSEPMIIIHFTKFRY